MMVKANVGECGRFLTCLEISSARSSNPHYLNSRVITISFLLTAMQSTVSGLRTTLWNNLKVYFDEFTPRGGEMQLSTVEEFIRTVLGEETQQQVDYVMKNIFRLDSDKSGTVSFRQLANFLFQRHCAEMSLQVMHRSGKMSKGSERKMTAAEFETLCNNAWKFLNVSIPSGVARDIFNDADKDRDGLITYVEYFQFIEKHICQTQAQFQGKTENKPVAKPVDMGPERFSRLRKWIWDQLFKLYNTYVGNNTLQVNDKDLRGLVMAILGDLSQAQILFLLNGLLELADRTIKFQPFAMIFIYLVAELGLSRYSKNHGVSKKSINKDQFVILFKNSFKVFDVARIKPQFLYKMFARIDKDNDGLISFEQYLDWVKRFLCVLKYFGDQFWVSPDDDLTIRTSQDNFLIKDKPIIQQIKPKQRYSYIKFKFSNYDFAIQVRKRMFQALSKFDKNRDKQFDDKEIGDALMNLLKEDQYEVYYMVKNVFRYDRNMDGLVTYDELTDFCVQQHFGQMAIQRLHRKNGNYSHADKRQMNKQEFAKTLNYALKAIDIQCPPNLIDLLFSQIDLNRSGWISYQVYFLFLKYYFGSQNIVFKKNTQLDEWDQLMLSLKGLSPIDYFIRLILDQLRKTFLSYDSNKNLVFQIDQIEVILKSVFQLDENQISYVLYSFFKFESKQDKFATFEELVAIILEVFFIEVVIKRKYKDSTQGVRFSLQQFVDLIRDNTFFLRFKPDQQLCTQVFQLIDTDKDGWITLIQYMNFIRKYLGRGLNIIDQDPKKLKNKPKPSNVPGVSEEELAFIELVWGELKVYFDKYDIGAKGYLEEAELKAFIIEVLQETTQKELDYVFWNIFRADPDGNKQVQFEQFAPFILSHAGQIALQRFHKQQVKGKNSLSFQEMFVVFSNAFSFLSSISKQKSVIQTIYQRIGKGKNPSYGAYLGWITLALAKRFR